ncbi:velvet factor-domain-containing protein [Piptocephalis cylindrospora]|uniref:Velvet factor-domain-containing protein n=1 Tax=Piptocephalis cylindrospora TaxID=1907219 RepID=A0A4P9XZ40_9FUNG|nr:velvet factor-domain-containing protein [Piptocephalis cylindrospora]|eukprot:RKP11715.1 velvet factor-domain-containing protein [Piptocephalis cylindrospora]
MSLSLPCPPSARNLTYDLTIVQQPLHARMCGFGDKDRRPVDPPPILQLHIREPGEERIKVQVDTTLLVVHVDLTYPDGSCSDPESSLASTFPDPITGHPTRNLLGTIMGSACHLQGTNRELGIYYIFSDLSIRTEGIYQLGFTLMNLEGGEIGEAKVVAQAYSKPFTVYPPKRFPGMTESTPLSRCLAQQGIRIPIRKGSKGRGLEGSVEIDGLEEGGEEKAGRKNSGLRTRGEEGEEETRE